MAGHRSAPRRPRAPGHTAEAKPFWERSGVHAWFHYPTPELAARIGREQVYRAQEGGHQLRGPGLFVTNIAPGALPDDELLKLLFALQRPVSSIEGVVVLDTEGGLAFEQYGRGKWHHPAVPETVIDLGGLLIGFGVRIDGQWLFSRSIFS
jgi:hypothetical protein